MTDEITETGNAASEVGSISVTTAAQADNGSDSVNASIDSRMIKSEPASVSERGAAISDQSGESKEELLLDAKGLMKAYRGRRVVQGVNIHVHRGEVVGLLGPNGAGKTTSFYMIMGLIKPDAGTIIFKGLDVSHFPMYVRARMGMGYLAQEPSIFRKLTVEDNIMAILETLAISRKERKTRLVQLLNELQLTHLAKQKAMTLSGGERRRLEITRAMVSNPSFILLDEPFSGVDPISVYEVQQIILELKKKNLGILITDHNVRETLACVDRAYLMAQGQILCEGTSDYLINNKEAQKTYLGPQFAM